MVLENLLVDITKILLGPLQHLNLRTAKKKKKIKKKEDEIQAFPNPFFPLFGQNWRLSKNMRRYRHNSVHIQENTD